MYQTITTQPTANNRQVACYILFLSSLYSLYNTQVLLHLGGYALRLNQWKLKSVIPTFTQPLLSFFWLCCWYALVSKAFFFPFRSYVLSITWKELRNAFDLFEQCYILNLSVTDHHSVKFHYRFYFAISNSVNLPTVYLVCMSFILQSFSKLLSATLREKVRVASHPHTMNILQFCRQLRV